MKATVPLVTLAIASSTPARGDHCAPPAARLTSPRALNEPSFTRLTLGASQSRIARADLRADVFGAHLGLAFDSPAWRLASWLPFWSIAPDASPAATARGLGDVGFSASRSLIPAASRRAGFDAGLALALTLPVGDASEGLGMGHAMLSPSAWAALGLGPVTISARAGASASLGAASHAHHGLSSGLTPVVAPMNPAELNTSAGVAWRGPSKLTLSAELSAATPVGAHGGVARSTVAASVALHLSEGLELALGLALPLAGAPFVAQGQAAIAGRLPAP